MSPEALLSYILAIFVFSITPGPGVFAVLAKALRAGVKPTLPLSLGMAFSDVVYLVLACYGLSSLATHWGEAFVWVRWIGGAYLLFLAVQMWRAPIADLDDARQGEDSSALSSFVQGFLISASNPKVILFYIAFLPTFLDVSRLSWQAILGVSGATVVALMSGLSLLAYLAAWARRHLRSAPAQQGLNRSAAGLMGLAGVYLVVRQ